MKRGDRVLILPRHHLAGETGTYRESREMSLGFRHVIELDNGTRCLAKGGEFEAEDASLPSVCPECCTILIRAKKAKAGGLCQSCKFMRNFRKL